MSAPYSADAGGYIQVEFDSLATGAANLGVAHAALVSELERLDGQVRGSLAEWSSTARTVYQVKSDDNRRQADYLATLLLKMATHVQNAHEAYTATELQNARIWI